ncbi:MAG: histone deacetylase family protein [Azospirillaceae bacterium]|nr:histone deacetylase family protein [Azospirillaceae bacterium]
MTTALYYHPQCLEHVTGDDHPESPERLRAVLAALDALQAERLDHRLAIPATRDQISLVHDRDYVAAIMAAAPGRGLLDLGDGTMISPGSVAAALLAVGAVCGAVEAVLDGAVQTAFCAVRPPGHHAEPNRAMGFCLFNNVAIGARYALSRGDVRRVAIIDFDVHHGNGTQVVVDPDPALMLLSTHQSPLYPGTGAADQVGDHANVINIPLAAGSGSPEFRRAVTARLAPALARFPPDLIMISAGFDAHWRDPLADLNLVEDDFRWVTRKLVELARLYCRGRIVSTLEGGYDVAALASCCVAHVRALAAP